MNEAKLRTVFDERDQLRQEVETLKYRVTVLNDIGGEDHLLRCQTEEKLAAVKAENEILRKVADAAVKFIDALDSFGKVKYWVYIDRYNPADYNLRAAVREYRKLMEGENDDR